MAHVYRAPMRSRRSDVEPGAAVERALRLGLCGMGAVLAAAPSNRADALAALSVQYDERWAARVQRFAAAEDGSLVWTRDIDGLYWLGSLGGPWRYDASAEAKRVDLVHVRSCRWPDAPIAVQHVPAGVLASFARGGKNWQRIHAPGAYPESMRLWDRAGRPEQGSATNQCPQAPLVNGKIDE